MDKEHYRKCLEFIQDLADNGLRCDLTPTMVWKDTTDLHIGYTEYLKRVDDSIRERARYIALNK